MFGEGEVVELDGKFYLVFRSAEYKGSTHLYVELSEASEELVNAFYDKKYEEG